MYYTLGIHPLGIDPHLGTLTETKQKNTCCVEPFWVMFDGCNPKGVTQKPSDETKGQRKPTGQPEADQGPTRGNRGQRETKWKQKGSHPVLRAPSFGDVRTEVLAWPNKNVGECFVNSQVRVC